MENENYSSLDMKLKDAYTKVKEDPAKKITLGVLIGTGAIVAYSLWPDAKRYFQSKWNSKKEKSP